MNKFLETSSVGKYPFQKFAIFGFILLTLGCSVSQQPLEIRLLRSISAFDLTVLHPTYVPKGFTLESISAEMKYNEGVRYADYKIEYCQLPGTCFWIESAYGEIGSGPGGDYELTGVSPILGPFKVDVIKPGSEGNSSSETYYLGHWMPDSKLKEAEAKGIWPSAGRYHHFRGSASSDNEVIRVIESLRIVD